MGSTVYSVLYVFRGGMGETDVTPEVSVPETQRGGRIVVTAELYSLGARPGVGHRLD